MTPERQAKSHRSLVTSRRAEPCSYQHRTITAHQQKALRKSTRDVGIQERKYQPLLVKASSAPALNPTAVHLPGEKDLLRRGTSLHTMLKTSKYEKTSNYSGEQGFFASDGTAEITATTSSAAVLKKKERVQWTQNKERGPTLTVLEYRMKKLKKQLNHELFHLELGDLIIETSCLNVDVLKDQLRKKELLAKRRQRTVDNIEELEGKVRKYTFETKIFHKFLAFCNPELGEVNTILYEPSTSNRGSMQEG